MQKTTITLRRRVIASALTALTLLATAACGSESAADPPATSAVIPNTAPETIVPPSTTSTTEPSPSTAPPTSTSISDTSTAPSSTPSADLDQAKHEVIAAAETAWRTFNDAKLDPTNDSKFDQAVAAYTGTAQERIREFLRQYRESNRRSVTFDLAPATLEVDEQSIELGLESGVASVRLCDLDSNVMVETGVNPDGSDRVVDDSITAFALVAEFRLVDGAWLYAETLQREAFEGALTCGESA